jgi:hypothetical protein
MKKILFISFALFSLISCSKDGDLGISGSMKATINEVAWKSLIPGALLTNEKFTITGTDVSGKTLIITTMETSEGTYQLPSTSIQFTATYKESLSASLDDTYIAVSGTVELTSVNSSSKVISGTFSLVLRKNLTGDEVTITDGEFTNVKYTQNQ